jgi:hypothetical protein
MQLHRHGEAVAHRGIHSPELIEHIRIGYSSEAHKLATPEE